MCVCVERSFEVVAEGCEEEEGEMRDIAISSERSIVLVREKASGRAREGKPLLLFAELPLELPFEEF